MSDLKGKWRYASLLPHQRGLLYSEYLAFGLDQKPREEARNYLGAVGAAQLALRVNTGSNRRGLVADKFLFDGLMRGFDMPTPELQAVWQRPAKAMGFVTIGRKDGLRNFLRNEARFPIFVKPSQGSGGKGCFQIDAYGAADDTVILANESPLPLAEVATRMSFAQGGAILQSQIRQHSQLLNRVGPTIASIRAFSYPQNGRATLVAALWRVPRAGSVTDNARIGGMLCALDPQTGEVGPARTRLTRDTEWLTHHPDTGAEIAGMTLPHWKRVRWVVARAAELLHELPLIGWDIALAQDGPIIVEANASPSLDGLQYVADHGILAGPLGAQLLHDARANMAASRAWRRKKWRHRWEKLKELRG